ncbi:hypothetical protein [Pseudoduganella umbonata]|uniref:Uncharacterized protein n=1 Tax=Pseudoduganella umbonata TaxID=864828 RepID=A0A7W5HC44_9BURK|nr:hypothetical protein [Pseudoduganella umbonata]MBB3221274.1 hypothetical protein [Pseudoduganella umbonata]
MQHLQAMVHRLPKAARFLIEMLACRAMVHLPGSEVHRLRRQLAERKAL